MNVNDNDRKRVCVRAWVEVCEGVCVHRCVRVCERERGALRSLTELNFNLQILDFFN